MAETRLSNLPLDWVRAFEIAGRTGSFTAAAKECDVSQAAISQRISNLEGRIGVRLFVRGARGVVLSVEGEAWLPYVSAAFRSLDESYAEVFGIQREKITIAASASVNALWLAPRLKDWRDRHGSQIVLSTMVLQADDSLLETTLRVQYGIGEGKNRFEAPLFVEQLSPVASPDLLVGKRAWRMLPRLAVSGPRLGWNEWARHTGDPITPVPKLRFDSFSAALSAALSGAGVLLASLPLCASLIDAGRLVRLSQDKLEPQETYWMIANKAKMTKTQWAAIKQSFLAEDAMGG